MKKIILGMFVLSALALSCSKKESKAEPVQEVESHRYVAEDGTNAIISLADEKDAKTISIRTGQMTLKATESERKGDTIYYTNDDIEIKTWDNKLTITQGNNLIELTKAKTLSK